MFFAVTHFETDNTRHVSSLLIESPNIFSVRTLGLLPVPCHRFSLVKNSDFLLILTVTDGEILIDSDRAYIRLEKETNHPAKKAEAKIESVRISEAKIESESLYLDPAYIRLTREPWRKRQKDFSIIFRA